MRDIGELALKKNNIFFARGMKVFIPAALSAIALMSCSPQSTTSADGVINPENWPEAKSPFEVDPEAEKKIVDLLAKMSVEEKVGQIIQADINSVTPEEAKEFHKLFMMTFVGFTGIAVVAHLLVWMWRPWIG